MRRFLVASLCSCVVVFLCRCDQGIVDGMILNKSTNANKCAVIFLRGGRIVTRSADSTSGHGLSELASCPDRSACFAAL